MGIGICVLEETLFKHLIIKILTFLIVLYGKYRQTSLPCLEPGVNCAHLLDKDVFGKRARKVRCGLCYNCSQQPDCGVCRVCRARAASSSRQVCVRRSCLQPVDLYQLRQGQEQSILSREEHQHQVAVEVVTEDTGGHCDQEDGTCITMNADVVEL